MAEFYKGFVFERDVSAPLTIEGIRIPVACVLGGSGFTAKLPSGETISAASVSALARLYIVRSGDLARRNRLAEKHFQELRMRKDKDDWSQWRRENPDIRPVLANNKRLSVEFKDRTLAGYDFSYTNLCQANMQGLHLEDANFHQAILARADLSGAHLEGANFCRTDLYETNFRNAFLARANLQGVQMVRTILAGADLRSCKVYGLSAWDLTLDQPPVKQELIVRYRPSCACGPNRGEEEVQVESLDLAAFIYLTLNNRNISRVIEETGRKWVLLLGRFTRRKSVLAAIAKALKQRQLIPIIFDFPPPERRDLIETIMLLAGMSALVIVEITSPRSTPMELQAIVPNYGVPVVPVIEGEGKEFGTFSGLRKFPWVRPTIHYDTEEELKARLQEVVGREIAGANDPIEGRAWVCRAR
jgi:hypothetical protein